VGTLGDDIEVRVLDAEMVGQADWRATFYATRPGDAWGIEGHARCVNGRLVITRLTVDLDAAVTVPAPDGHPTSGWSELRPPAGIDSRLLRRVPLAHILDRVRTDLLNRPEMDRVAAELGVKVPGGVREVNFRAAIDTATTEAPPKRGRPGLGDDYYRRFALAAVSLQRSGQTTGLRRALREHFKLDTYDNVRDRIRKCRELGFLEAGRPGVRGWMPGPRLIEDQTTEGGD
jgi:hypothetical protein